ncbi:MAG TPA: LuxR C-terminal-related transcriptional regulator [Candidatus Competibacteraceae bacterium]|nr:LuxR C-terminal-related transcriptional regulator [Candidatus Competibacteraceae bacterium]HRZ05281.1 LuxR C-terminal-related transcriptional regulator [Candidatus Competibacteraceae bacterium]HSA45558.1 LuxR C-terminal-related transcriptional regulator [Candidatus Competibacteraceae bacterium]
MSHCDTAIIYILDPDAALRDALRRLVESVGLSTWASAEVEAFLIAYQPERPACMLLDLRIPGSTKSSIQEDLRAQGVDLPVIVMTYRSDVATAVAAMKQGAMDFLEKPVNEQLLLDCVHHAVAEDRVRRRTRAWRQALLGRFSTLTPREQDILQRVAEGLSNREIADRLALSHKTVEVHRAKVMQKMGARTLSQLIRMAMALGILKLYDGDE